jgi:hypothetical protein
MDLTPRLRICWKAYIWSDSGGMMSMTCMAIAPTEEKARAILRKKHPNNDDLEHLLSRKPIILGEGEGLLNA